MLGLGGDAALALPWLAVALATAVGAGFVGRRLEPRRRHRLWAISALMVFPAGLISLKFGGARYVLTDDLYLYSAVGFLLVLAGWALVEFLAAFEVWDRAIGPVQWIATLAAVVGLLGWAVFFLLFEVGDADGIPSRSAGFVLVNVGIFVPFSAPALAGLLPAVLAWPEDEVGRSVDVRRGGAFALLAGFLVFSIVTVAGVGTPTPMDMDTRAHDFGEVPSRGELEIGLEVRPRSGSEGTNVTVPFLVANETPANGTRPFLEELREGIVHGYPGSLSGNFSEDGRTVWVDRHTERRTAIHRPWQELTEIVHSLRLAGPFATGEGPGNVEVVVWGQAGLGPGRMGTDEPFCFVQFKHTLPVRDAANATAGRDAVPIAWKPVGECEDVWGPPS